MNLIYTPKAPGRNGIAQQDNIQCDVGKNYKEDNKEPHFFTPNSPDANLTKHTWNAMK